VTIRAHPDGDHDGLGDHLVVDLRLAVGGVPSLLEIPAATPTAWTRSSTLRVDTPCR
jgi:hypothetical protein